MWKKFTGMVCAAVLAAGLLAGCSGDTGDKNQDTQTTGEVSYENNCYY